MYVEIKKPGSGKKYVYLKRSVRINGRVKHITVERLGELNELLAHDPDFIEKLTAKCREGSPDLFYARLASFERNVAQAEARCVNATIMPLDPAVAAATPANAGTAGAAPAGGNAQGAEAEAVVLTLFDSKHKTTGLTPAQQEQLVVTYAAVDALNSIFDVAGAHAYSAAASAAQVSVVRGAAAGGAVAADNSSAQAPAAGTGQSAGVPGRYPVFVRQGFIDVVVPAAGIGSRMGAELPKQYLKLDDKCVLEHTVLKLLACPYVNRVIVVLAADDPYFRFTCLSDMERVVRVTGGNERVDSVLSGLSAVTSSWVMVHDAARPLVSLSDLEKLLLEVTRQSQLGYSGGILAVPMADTVKQERITPSVFGAAGAQLREALPITPQPEHKHSYTIGCTLDRSHMFRALTPQLFKTEQLKAAIVTAQRGGAVITDEASAVEYVGGTVALVEGSPLNFKLTQPSDLLLVKALLGYCAPAM